MCSLRVDSPSVALCLCFEQNGLTNPPPMLCASQIELRTWFIHVACLLEKWSHTIFQELLQSTVNPCSSSVIFWLRRMTSIHLHLDLFNAVFHLSVRSYFVTISLYMYYYIHFTKSFYFLKCRVLKGCVVYFWHQTGWWSPSWWTCLKLGCIWL